MKSFGNCRFHVTATNWIGVPHLLAVWKGIDPGFRFEFHPSIRIGRAPYQQVDPTLQVSCRKFLEPLRQADHQSALLLRNKPEGAPAAKRLSEHKGRIHDPFTPKDGFWREYGMVIPPQDHELVGLANGSIGNWTPARAGEL